MSGRLAGVEWWWVPRPSRISAVIRGRKRAWSMAEADLGPCSGGLSCCMQRAYRKASVSSPWERTGEARRITVCHSLREQASLPS